MPVPFHPKKHRERALVTAAAFHRYHAKHAGTALPKPPPKVVLVFGSRWRAYLNRRYGGRFDRYTGVFRVNESVGICRISGPGAPFATIVVEELAALGVREFIIVGLAGSLRPDLRVGSLVLCRKALRDEGTSYHYAGPSDYARPSPRLVARVKRALVRERIHFAEGPTWTTDAPYRETRAELRRYRRMRIVTVEMEASAVFAAAAHLGRSAAALFVISDHLEEQGWKPRFHDTTSGLRQALGVALTAFGA